MLFGKAQMNADLYVEVLLVYRQVVEIHSHNRRLIGGVSPSRRPSR